jgi:hypothetical protein
MNSSPINFLDAAKLECALRLKLKSNYEKNFLENLKDSYKRMGGNCQLTDKQRNLLTSLSNRYLHFKNLCKTGAIPKEKQIISHISTESNQDSDLRGDEPEPF